MLSDLNFVQTNFLKKKIVIIIIIITKKENKKRKERRKSFLFLGRKLNGTKSEIFIQ